MMNVISDRWISLRRRSGVVESVAPWEVTDRREEDPFVAFASVRADFDGALAQFLIGLLQTALAPAGAAQWRRRLAAPPSPAALHKALQPFASAFELFGEGPRFLQDLTLAAEAPNEDGIERLLIEAPGAHTLRQGKDHFVKGGRIEALCPACAASALLALQINAPSGGQGHRTGLRGGGPLTTLVVQPESLWQTLWLNVLPSSRLGPVPAGKDRPEDRFPWLAPTRTSGKAGGLDTTAADVHPLQMYWAMPRRIRLRPHRAAEPADAVCSLCAGAGRPLVRTFFQRNLGVSYTGSWSHPLTPYRKADEESFPLHGNPAGLSYRNWLGLVASDPDERIRPAAAVEAFLADADRSAVAGCVLWAFGYDMDNMKARAWVDRRLPLLTVSPGQREAFELEVRRLVSAAVEASRSLVFAAKQALTNQPKDLPRDPAEVGVRFWQETEAPFHEHLLRIRERLTAGEDTEPLRRQWQGRLWTAAGRAFASVTPAGAFEAGDPRRSALAWTGLQRFFHSGRLRGLLGLTAGSEAVEAATAAGGISAGAPSPFGEPTMRHSFSHADHERRGKVLRHWHQGLERASRARLRRAATPDEVILDPGFHQLLARLRPVFQVDDPGARRNLAALAGLAAQVREHAAGLPLARQMGTPPARKSASGPPVSEQRFRRLLAAASLEDRYTQLSRVIRLLGDRVDLLSLGDAICDWDDDAALRQQWAYDYYQAAYQAAYPAAYQATSRASSPAAPSSRIS
jgi:CRISPR system Cascade subunit CasA